MKTLKVSLAGSRDGLQAGFARRDEGLRRKPFAKHIVPLGDIIPAEGPRTSSRCPSGRGKGTLWVGSATYFDGLPPIGDLRQGQVSTLRAAQSETEKELSALMPSILDRAFKGEL